MDLATTLYYGRKRVERRTEKYIQQLAIERKKERYVENIIAQRILKEVEGIFNHLERSIKSFLDILQ